MPATAGQSVCASKCKVQAAHAEGSTGRAGGQSLARPGVMEPLLRGRSGAQSVLITVVLATAM